VHSQSREAAGAAVVQRLAFDFETTFRENYQRIARVILRIVGDPGRAEELAGEAFWRLWRTPRAQGEGSAGWLHRTAVRLALDELRRRTRRAHYEHLLAVFRRSPQTPDELFSATEEQGRVRAVLASMAPRQAELLLLRSDGFPYDELATALSITPTSVGTLLSRAKTAFRKEYVKRYGEQ
jgi:RNA polymerase sigma-70 factor (ECF subfamily)